MKVTGTRVLVKPFPKEIKASEGGIVLPENAKISEIVKARVEAVGKGYLTDSGIWEPLEVIVGDIVYYSEYSAGVELGNGYVVLAEKEILAIV